MGSNYYTELRDALTDMFVIQCQVEMKDVKSVKKRKLMAHMTAQNQAIADDLVVALYKLNRKALRGIRNDRL